MYIKTGYERYKSKINNGKQNDTNLGIFRATRQYGEFDLFYRSSPPERTRIYYYFILYFQFSFRSEHQIKSPVRTEEHPQTREREEKKRGLVAGICIVRHMASISVQQFSTFRTTCQRKKVYIKTLTLAVSRLQAPEQISK